MNGMNGIVFKFKEVKMALVMTIKPAMGNNINFPVELRFSTQFFEFINNQSDSDKEILEKGFHIEEFGKKSIIKCCFFREALIKLLRAYQLIS